MHWLALACTSTEPIDSGPLRGPVQLAFPLDQRELFDAPVGMDHDPVEYSGAEALICTAYDGRPFPACYDGHGGSDFLLDGGFERMDAGSVLILAAAPGTVVEVEDGHYDRCHGTLDEGNDCDGEEMVSNTVTVEHEDGWRTRYLHMMRDAMTVEVGDRVDCGSPLGRVGSSGNSSTPHLHLGLEDPSGQTVDPYAGEYSQPETFWLEQGDPEGLPGGCP